MIVRAVPVWDSGLARGPPVWLALHTCGGWRVEPGGRLPRFAGAQLPGVVPSCTHQEETGTYCANLTCEPGRSYAGNHRKPHLA